MLTRKPLILAIAFVSLMVTAPASALWTFDRPLDNFDELRSSWSEGSDTYVVGDKGKAYHFDGTEWEDISDPIIESANLFTVFGTSPTSIYAAGYRKGPARFDTNGDKRIDKDDNKSLYGVIFRYNGTLWEELSLGFPEDSPYFASSFVSIWSDGDHAIYVAGGKQLTSNRADPLGICLKISGTTITPIVGISTLIPIADNPSAGIFPPTINHIWGTDDAVYFACSRGTILKLNRYNDTIATMRSTPNSVDFRGIWGDLVSPKKTLYAVGADTNGGRIFTYHATNGWIRMGIDKSQLPPIYTICGKSDMILATGSYGKAYVLKKEEDNGDVDYKETQVWTEILSGTGSDINHMHENNDTFIAVSSNGETYKITETDPETAYILSDTKVGMGTMRDGVLQLDVTLTDFTLGDIWKRDWSFNNGSHNDPVSATGKIYSKTQGGDDTLLKVLATPGLAGNRKVRIIDCKGCTPYADVVDDVVKLYIQGGITNQQTMKDELIRSSAIKDAMVMHPASAWIIKKKPYDTFTLSGGRENENIFENLETTGDSYFHAAHRYKDEGTYEPKLTVHLENTAYLGGSLKLTGQRVTYGDSDTKVSVHVEDIESKPCPAKGVLGGLINIETTTETPSGIVITMAAIDSEADPIDSEDEPIGPINSTYADSTLHLTLETGTTIEQIIAHLDGLDLEGAPNMTASFAPDNHEHIDETKLNTVWSFGMSSRLKKGSGAATGILDGLLYIEAKAGYQGNISVSMATDPNADEISSRLSGNTLILWLHPGATIQEVREYLTPAESPDEAKPGDAIIKTVAFVSENHRGEGGTDLLESTPWAIEDFSASVTLKGGSNFVDYQYDSTTKAVTVYIENTITTSTDIAREVSKLREVKGDTSTPLIFLGILPLIYDKPWDTSDESITHSATMQGVRTKEATTTVRVVPEAALGFSHTPKKAKLSATVTFQDTSTDLDIQLWEWAVFKQLIDGKFETKATVRSTNRTAQVTVNGLGTYNIGLKATLSDGSIMTKEMPDAITITGKHAGHSSWQGANGCFVQSVH